MNLNNEEIMYVEFFMIFNNLTVKNFEYLSRTVFSKGKKEVYVVFFVYLMQTEPIWLLSYF